MGSVLRSHGVTMPTWSVWFSVLMRELWNLSTCILPRMTALHLFPPTDKWLKLGEWTKPNNVSPALFKNNGCLIAGGPFPKTAWPTHSFLSHEKPASLVTVTVTPSCPFVRNLTFWMAETLWNRLAVAPRHLFEGLERGVAALQFLQRASNIGKVVIRSPSRSSVPNIVGMWIKNVKRNEQGDKWATG